MQYKWLPLRHFEVFESHRTSIEPELTTLQSLLAGRQKIAQKSHSTLPKARAKAAGRKRTNKIPKSGEWPTYPWLSFARHSQTLRACYHAQQRPQ